MESFLSCTLSLVASVAALSCASSSGTEPHAMSAAEHQASAAQEDAKTEAHAGQYDPNAKGSPTTCVASRGGACWTSLMNPTAGHSKDADRHRELAAKHRAASEALRTAEASACRGIPEDDRDISPFDHREDIRSV